MILSFDIETMPNLDMVDQLPIPEVKYGNTKDPEKRALMDEKAKEKQVDKMGLDPMWGRVICSVFTNGTKSERDIISELTDEQEKTHIEWIFSMLALDEARFFTWNGKGFDFRFVYMRAMILGVDRSAFGAPPLSVFLKRYNNDRHTDLMLEWDPANKFTKLDTVAKVLLGEGKQEISFADFPELIKTKDGRQEILDYCEQDTKITHEIGLKMNDYLF